MARTRDRGGRSRAARSGRFLLWRKPWRNWRPVTDDFDPIPLFEGLRPILRISNSEQWYDWIEIPADIASPNRTNPVVLRLPPTWTQTDPRHEHVVRVAAHYLPGQWTPVWYVEGVAEFHPLPDGDFSGGPASSLPRYRADDVDPLFAENIPIVIDGDEIRRTPRDR